MYPLRTVVPLTLLAAVAGGAVGAGAVQLVGGANDRTVAIAAAEEPAAPPTAGSIPLAPTSGASVPDGPSDEPGQDQLAAIAALRAELDAAAAERSQLAATLLGMNREMASLEQAIGAFNLPAGGLSGDPAADAASAMAESGGALGDPASAGARAGSRSGLNVDGLQAAGVDPLVSAELERRSDAWQLARLELVDRAAREGWDDSEELERQLDQLGEERPDLREELGDDRYDAYLFAAGRSNRIGVESVIPGSAAEVAGLSAGDIVLGYANERLFDVRSLQRATRAGSLGESVTLQALRDGQSLSLQVPRGPLGVTLSPLRREP